MSSHVELSNTAREIIQSRFANLYNVNFFLHHLYDSYDTITRIECIETLKYVMGLIKEIVRLNQSEPIQEYQGITNTYIAIISIINDLPQNGLLVNNFVYIERILQYIYKFEMNVNELSDTLNRIGFLILSRVDLFQSRVDLFQSNENNSSRNVATIRVNKIVTINHAGFNKKSTDCCSICFEYHKKGETILTSCKHCFGAKCYKDWVNSESYNNKCPMCRKKNPSITKYKYSRNSNYTTFTTPLKPYKVT